MSSSNHSRLKHEGAMARIRGSWFANSPIDYVLDTEKDRAARRQGFREEGNRQQTRQQRAERNQARRERGGR